MLLRASKEVEHIKTMVLRMATLAEESVRDATDAFMKCDTELAERAIERDSEINQAEMHIDKEVFQCLALKAPVAGDLRLLFSIQKINKDLERIGDHAVNIAQAAINSYGFCKQVSSSQIRLMSTLTVTMFSDAITCFAKSDSQLALHVLEHDDQVDDLNRAMTREVITLVKQDITSIEASLELLRVSKNLERIADLSTNIAEDVIFHAKALDVKHRHVSDQMLDQE
jgi:phosphate transport system protein